MEKKNRKPMIAVIALIALLVIGGTLAYFSASGAFDNKFNTADFNNEIVEVFNPDDAKDLTPGATVNKDVIVNNTGEIPVLARVKYTETGSDAMKAAMLKTYKNASDWTLADDGYYYYTKVVAAGATVQHLDSVQLDPTYTGSATTSYYYQTADSSDWTKMTDDQKSSYESSQSFNDASGNAVKYTAIKQKTEKAGEDYTLKAEVQTIQASEITAADLTAAWGSDVPAAIQALVPAE